MENFLGLRLGKKTLKFFCDENGIDINFTKEKLLSQGIKMEEGNTFKEIAEKYDTSPIEILKVILLKDYKI